MRGEAARVVAAAYGISVARVSQIFPPDRQLIRRIRLNHSNDTLVQRLAAERGTGPSKLLSRIIRAVLRDNLVDTILDGLPLP